MPPVFFSDCFETGHEKPGHQQEIALSHILKNIGWTLFFRKMVKNCFSHKQKHSHLKFWNFESTNDQVKTKRKTPRESDNFITFVSFEFPSVRTKIKFELEWQKRWWVKFRVNKPPTERNSQNVQRIRQLLNFCTFCFCAELPNALWKIKI